QGPQDSYPPPPPSKETLLPGFSVCISHVYDVTMTERTGHYSDPADPEGLRLAVSQQGVAFERQAESLNQMATAQQDLFRRLDSISQTLVELTSQRTANASPISTASAAGSSNQATTSWTQENFRLQPEPFQGDVSSCGGFLLQCQQIFQQAPRHYQADHSRITLIVNALRGKALQWAQAYLTANSIYQTSYERFLGEFRLVFDQPRKEEEATRRLLNLKQRHRSVSDHLIDFRILAVEAGWPDIALKGVFYQSLSDSIKDHLCSQPEANSFEELVTAALRSDVRLRERQAERSRQDRKTNPNSPSSSPAANFVHVVSHDSVGRSAEEPMQIGHSKLTPEARQRRREEGACFYCGQADCLRRPRRSPSSPAARTVLGAPPRSQPFPASTTSTSSPIKPPDYNSSPEFLPGFQHLGLPSSPSLTSCCAL
uniref:Retrotransposon gag domain-containing protein n=1 Tax=Oryzias latipes TaxID=8090 RepID=A0A3P9J1C8_ORYLA